MTATPPPGPIHVTATLHGATGTLAATLSTLAEAHRAPEVPCHASVLSTGADPDARAALEHHLAGRLEIAWVEVDPARLGASDPAAGADPADVCVLLLPELLPQDCERAVYLGYHTAVRRPLSELWRVDLGDAPLGAVRHGVTPYAGLTPAWEPAGMEPSADYFDMGVMVLPLGRWRRQGLHRSALEALRRHPELGVEGALNKVAAGRWHQLPRRWNLQTSDATGWSHSWALWRQDVEAAVADPAIVQYSPHHNPWTAASAHPYPDLADSALAGTPWAPRAQSADSAGRRIRRAAEVLLRGRAAN